MKQIVMTYLKITTLALVVQEFNAQQHWRPPSGSFNRNQDLQVQLQSQPESIRSYQEFQAASGFFKRDESFQPPPQIPSEYFKKDENFQAHPQMLQQTQCPVLVLVNRTEDQWNWNLLMTSLEDAEDVQVEVTFEEVVPAFVNDLSYSSTLDNRNFIIHSSKKLKSGQRLQVGLSAKTLLPLGIPRITEVKFNGRRICPDESFSSAGVKEVLSLPSDDRDQESSFSNSSPLNGLSIPGGNGCTSLFKKEGEVAGRWDGVLSIFSKIPKNHIRVDLIFDQKTWVLGNDLGETKTTDQKHFTITSMQPVHPSTPVKIDFFVKYDEFEPVPQLRSIFVDGEPLCFSNDVSNQEKPSRIQTSSSFPMNAQRSDEILLSSLPFQNFPGVTLLPLQVDNSQFECGIFQAGLNNRFSNGRQAETGQYPFHTAIFRDLHYKCGGSLITDKAVLTAAHCVVDDNRKPFDAGRFRVLFGSVNLKTLTGREAMREIDEVVSHPDYENDKILKQDIALMTIKSLLQFTPAIRPICLFNAPSPISNLVDQRGTVIGFGATAESSKPSLELHYGQMSVISRQQCIESQLVFGLLPEMSAFCAKAVNEMVACPGDSGGGLFFNINGKFYLRGVSSVTITGADQKCDPKASVAFTDVTYFLPWISNNLRVN